MQMQSISGIITQVRNTSGEVPPPLVGASVTVVGDRVFVFAGRLVTSRKMTNHMYVLDIGDLTWTRHIPPPDSDKPPKARYFHSASVHNNSIVVFGGMGYSRVSGDGLCVLDDISIFDIDTMSWRRPDIKPSLFAPRPRYAHLACIAEDNKLIIIGGQDMNNNYLGEINILDLDTWEWIQVKELDKHVGAYRSIAITTPPGTRLPAVLNMNDQQQQGLDDKESVAQQQQRRASMVRQYGQLLQNTQEPTPIYLYTNYNFADVKRELQLIFSPSSPSSSIEDCSSYMTGSVMPPGLRFPTGHTLGHHLVLAGTYLSPQSHAYTIWALNLGTLTWSRIETGSVFGTGSWNKGVLHADSNRLLVFGHRSRNLLEDYNHRQVNFDHVASVDLEAFGVYNLPKPTCSSLAQEMGLSLLNEPSVSDFRIITRERQSIAVNSAVLAQRWPYFAELMKTNRDITPETTSTTPTQQSNSNTSNDAPMPDDNESQPDTPQPQPLQRSAIKSHSMMFPYPHAVVVALLQYIYTDNLLTAQQYQPHVLSQLLLLADMYNLTRLRELTTHALHQMLNMSTAPLIFETAALSHQTSLQIRALKMMIAAKKMIQQQQQQQQRLTTTNTTSNGLPTEGRQRLPSSAGLVNNGGGDSPTSVTSGFMPNPSPQRQHFSSSASSPYVDSRTPSMYEPGNHSPSSSSAASPTLSTYRARTPSLTNRSNPLPSQQQQQQPRSSPFGTTRSTGSSTSPPSTPRQLPMGLPQHTMDTEDLNLSPSATPTFPLDQTPSSNTTTPASSAPKAKEKTKKKKPFLEAFGSKFSMSFQ